MAGPALRAEELAAKQLKLTIDLFMAKIRVFSTPFCPYCITLKQFLKERDVEFEEVDVSENKEALDEMVRKSGQMGVPVVEIDGEIVIGFDRERISRLLGIKD